MSYISINFGDIKTGNDMTQKKEKMSFLGGTLRLSLLFLCAFCFSSSFSAVDEEYIVERAASKKNLLNKHQNA